MVQAQRSNIHVLIHHTFCLYFPFQEYVQFKKKLILFFFDKDLFKRDIQIQHTLKHKIPNESQTISKVNMTVLEDRIELMLTTAIMNY